MTAAPDDEQLPLEVEEYLTWLRLERGRARSTVEAYRRDLRAWAEHLHHLGRAVTDVTEDDLVGWVSLLRDAGLAPSTRKRRIVAARNLHRFLAEEGHVDDDVGAAVAPPPVARGLPKALTEDEVDAQLARVEGDGPDARRDRAILETLYG
ncbi:MAG TPA: site-specific integrase, partial [Acidimicrobiales bacterium]